MSAPSPAVITLFEEHRASAPSDRADVVLAVADHGVGAPSPARARALRDALAAAGTPDDRVLLENVQHDSLAWVPAALGALALVPAAFVAGLGAAGLGAAGVAAVTALLAWARAHEVTSTLRVRCASLDEVRRVLDAAAVQRGATVRAVEWRSEVPDEGDLAADAACLRRARRRAEAIAAAEGLRVTVLRACEVIDDGALAPPPRPVGYERAEAHAARKRASFGEAAVGLAAAPREVTRRVRYVFEASAGG